MTLEEKVIEALKHNWCSEFRLNNIVKSASGGRIMRFLRAKQPLLIMERKRKETIDGAIKNYKEFRYA